jgi:predicted HicB family RNase H-like nuclease
MHDCTCHVHKILLKAGPLWGLAASRYSHDWKETNAVLTQSTEKYTQILTTAKRLYEQEPDWVTFFREVLGVDGMVRGSFTSLEELAAFERSQEFEQIQKWLVKLREQRNATDTESEPTRVITVRLPKSMHEYLRTEAHDLRTSMNKLCISKLLQVIEQDLIPAERGGTPERKPQLATATVSSTTIGGPSIGSSTIGSTNHQVHQPQQASPYQAAHTAY